ncbi:MAG: hypothetical protein GKS00_13510 [Alphaproteobacteria bacterium]|nr:hypothetical protein [Alphaproteobacteria bacterium]
MRSAIFSVGLLIAAGLSACGTANEGAEGSTHTVLLDGKTHKWFVGSVYERCETYLRRLRDIQSQYEAVKLESLEEDIFLLFSFGSRRDLVMSFPNSHKFTSWCQDNPDSIVFNAMREARRV